MARQKRVIRIKTLCRVWQVDSQTSQNMAIDWQTYNVNVDERVQYIQPNRSSISLNRILGNIAFQIRGRIDTHVETTLVHFNDTFLI